MVRSGSVGVVVGTAIGTSAGGVVAGTKGGGGGRGEGVTCGSSKKAGFRRSMLTVSTLELRSRVKNLSVRDSTR